VSINHIKVSRTARYFTLGELGDKTKSIWIVIHGYGELANGFIIQFEPLANAGHFVVAPEALNRFYWKGFGGKPVASWMTSEDRLNEIADYVNYLSELYGTLPQHLPLNVLGFSQGVATASRWIAMKNVKCQKLVFCSGEIGRELIGEQEAIDHFNQQNILFTSGNNDAFYSIEQVERLMQAYKQTGLQFDFKLFEGVHEVNVDLLMDV